jgi:hypothetical protein
VYRSSSNNITTLAAAQTNGTQVVAWTTNITSTAVTGLMVNTTYWFNVFVKDAGGNVTAYTSSSTTTPDTTAPVAGSSGTLTASSIATTSLTLAWSAATDNLTAQASLSYEVRQSSADNLSTVAMEANGTQIMTWAAAATSYAVTGLNPNTTYYFNVFVKDAAGNRAAYARAQVTTQSIVYVWAMPKSNGSIGARAAADGTCSVPTGLTCPSGVHALLSYSASDQVASFDVPGSAEVVGVKGTGAQAVIADTWSSMFGSGAALLKSIGNALGIAGTVWTGTNADGTFSNNTCNGWTNAGGLFGANGEVGDTTKTTNAWIASTTTGCGSKLQYLCICY